MNIQDADDLNELVDFEQEEDAIAERVEETKEQTDAGKKCVLLSKSTRAVR